MPAPTPTSEPTLDALRKREQGGTMNCRDCAKPGVRWCRDVGDPKGPRCWDCAKKHRERKR